MAVASSLASGCDQGKERVEPAGGGLPLVPVTLVNANIGMNTPLPANQPIQLQFDRLLQPLSITRQTFVLLTADGRGDFMPNVAYDPVSRIVTVTPLSDVGQTLTSGQSYELVIETPQGGTDVNGLRAIDGALLGAPSTRVIPFNVIDPTPNPPVQVTIDFCRDIDIPILQPQCSLSTCHGAAAAVPMTAAALVLDPPSYIAETAINQVAHTSNTGSRAVAAAPSLLFGQDMPIIDGTGNPGNSWLMYKLLLSIPGPEPKTPTTGADAGMDATVAEAGSTEAGSTEAGLTEAGLTDAEPTDAEPGDAEISDGGSSEAGAADAGTATASMAPPVDVSGVHAFPTTDLTISDRAVLTNYVQGLAMPVPPPHAALPAGLPLSQLERLSLWIAQGSPVPAGTCTNQ
jgi:hypothetical protein